MQRPGGFSDRLLAPPPGPQSQGQGSAQRVAHQVQWIGVAAGHKTLVEFVGKGIEDGQRKGDEPAAWMLPGLRHAVEHKDAAELREMRELYVDIFRRLELRLAEIEKICRP